MKAYILAGGESSRMKRDKGLIKINGHELVKHIANQLDDHFDEVIIISNNEDYKKLQFRVIGDLIEKKGPLSGLYTALFDSSDDLCLFTCDQPVIHPKMLNWLKKHQKCAILDGRIQPFPGFYSFSMINEVKCRIHKNDLSISKFINESKHFLTYPDSINITDLNTPEDLKKYLESIS